ncbi:hypothetical protein [Paenibacillus tarimensis]|uniref:hypothetical protein n=1 Tax=Paenibacillus tarimensis TaxID=416012 RepID=UPI001F38AE86|nr:hypothetical protein [Paenibacillus tarimensis]MCF2945649.1 hypothetical protein [Paenibacillus tarimensis]
MILWEYFDRNEWYVLIMLISSYAAVILLPRRIPAHLLILSLVWGISSAMLVDFTIGGGMMDFYKVNDSDRYELTDFLTYFMFAPFGYFFIYFYELLNIRKKTLIYYILGWTVVGTGVQWVSEWMKMTQYQGGYRYEYNIPVFLVIQTITGLFYAYLRAHPIIRENRRQTPG